MVASSAMELQLEFLDICWLHTQKQMQMKCIHDFHGQNQTDFLVFIFMLRLQYAGDICTWQIRVILIMEKHELESHVQSRMAPTSWISALYLLWHQGIKMKWYAMLGLYFYVCLFDSRKLEMGTALSVVIFPNIFFSLSGYLFLFKIISHTFVLSLWHHIELFTVCTKIFLGYNNETVKMAATEGSIIQHLVKNRSGSVFQLLIFLVWHICFVLFPSFTTGTLITEHEIVQWHNTANS